MNVDYSYVGVPTTQEAMAKEPVESLETYTLTEPEVPAAPKLSAPTVVSPVLQLIAQLENLTSQS